MISGIHAHICDKCIEQAMVILDEEVQNSKTKDSPQFKLLKPIEIKAFLDTYVIGQEDCLLYTSDAADD